MHQITRRATVADFLTSPLDAAQVQAWLLHRVSERRLSYETIRQAVCAIRFLFTTVLGRPDEALSIPYPRTPQRQPEILSREELARLFLGLSPKNGRHEVVI